MNESDLDAVILSGGGARDDELRQAFTKVAKTFLSRSDIEPKLVLPPSPE
jgi:hypothetical protein